MLRWVWLFFLFFIALKTHSQDNYAIGKIIDKETQLPVQDQNINVYSGQNKTYHTISDKDGKFIIPLKFFNKSDYVKITSVNYEELKVLYPSIIDSKLNGNINLGILKISASKIELKEVRVQFKKRYRDTTEINFLADTFERSVMINDLFSKKMGFYRDADGKLYYKGKIVSTVSVNGGEFFGNNNLDIHKYLPALILNSMEIVETDIDSLTNTTLLRPQVKINLKLKDKYKKGKFGYGNLGFGTLKRYILTTDLFTYNKNEQISFSPNSNNINAGDNISLNPNINFSATGNNLITSSSRITYRNLLFKNKVGINVFAKGKINSSIARSESELQDRSINRLSKTTVLSDSKMAVLEALNLDINYTIDSLNSLRASQKFNYSDTRRSDSLGYEIYNNDSLTRSSIDKRRNEKSRLLSSNLEYQKRFSSKKGRQLNIKFSLDKSLLQVNETNLATNYQDNTSRQYSIAQHRNANNTVSIADGTFTEPLSYDSYLTFSASYKRDNYNYYTNLTNDTIPGSFNNVDLFTYQYFNQAIKGHKSFNKFTVDLLFSSVYNTQNIHEKLKRAFWYADINFVIDYQLKKGKRLFTQYFRTTEYPRFDQLSGINNSLDFISQIQGNIKLKPEINNKLSLVYDLKRTDSKNLSLTGNIALYTNRFGYNINTINNQTPVGFMDNVGNSFNADMGFSLGKNLTNGNSFNYRTALAYQETPSITDQIREVNRGISISQSLSSNKTVMKSLSVSPSFFTVYSKNYYKASMFNQINLSYTDRYAFTVLAFELNIYPLLNYTYSIKSNFSFAANAEIKRKFLKNYAEVWLKGYDIFNSFNYNNNINGPYYIQTVKYHNLNRYFLIGASIKFNNMH